jgi:RNA polymerase sigma-70 factor, ECF subfamily
MAVSEHDRLRTTECHDGGQEAFENLVRKNQRMIHSLCYRLTGSVEEAEDLSQDTFLAAFQSRADFRAEAKVSTWLYRIAINRCLNWRKQQERQVRIQAHQSPDQPKPEAADADARRAQQIQDALMRLPAKQRAAIVLTTYEGLTHAEAARALRCSETTVSWRLFAARHKLKRLLKHLQNTGGDT